MSINGRDRHIHESAVRSFRKPTLIIFVTERPLDHRGSIPIIFASIHLSPLSIRESRIGIIIQILRKFYFDF